MASFLIKREVGVRSSIPFGGGGLGHKSSPRLPKVLSCVLSSTSSQITVLIDDKTLHHIRESESVIVSPSGSLLRLKSSILEFCLLDSSFALAER